MVGSGDRRGPSRASGRISKELGLGSQRMDGDWPCLGLDQHENYSRFHLLFYRDPDWNSQTVAGQRSHGPAVATGPRKLPCAPQPAAGIPSQAPVLVS
jgi:hypothetical protein